MTGIKQTLWRMTATLTYELYSGLNVRAEFRHDESSKRFFEGASLARPAIGSPTTRYFSGQDVVAWEVVYAF